MLIQIGQKFKVKSKTWKEMPNPADFGDTEISQEQMLGEWELVETPEDFVITDESILVLKSGENTINFSWRQITPIIEEKKIVNHTMNLF